MSNERVQITIINNNNTSGSGTALNRKTVNPNQINTNNAKPCRIEATINKVNKATLGMNVISSLGEDNLHRDNGFLCVQFQSGSICTILNNNHEITLFFSFAYCFVFAWKFLDTGACDKLEIILLSVHLLVDGILNLGTFEHIPYFPSTQNPFLLH